MEDQQWKVSVNNMDYSLETKVFIYRNTRDGGVVTLNVDPKGNLLSTFHEIKNSIAVTVPPTFSGRRDDVMEIVKAFIAYGNEQGFKNGDETFVKGKLEATENHLKDMRALLKLK